MREPVINSSGSGADMCICDRFPPNHYCRLFILFALFTALFFAEVFAADSLPPLHADLSETSVSGVSSGGCMAVQFHVAYSGLVSGVGVIAGGPYNCADRSLWKATHNCMHLLPSIPFLRSAISSLERINSLPRARLIILPIWLARRSGCYRAPRTQSSPNP